MVWLPRPCGHCGGVPCTLVGGPWHLLVPLIWLLVVVAGVVLVGYLVDLWRMRALVDEANGAAAAGSNDMGDLRVLGGPPGGLLGLHHFYLGRPAWGLAYMLSGGLLGVGFLADQCRMASLLERSRQPGGFEKRIGEAWLLWFPMGVFGLHRSHRCDLI